MLNKATSNNKFTALQIIVCIAFAACGDTSHEFTTSENMLNTEPQIATNAIDPLTAPNIKTVEFETDENFSPSNGAGNYLLASKTSIDPGTYQHNEIALAYRISLLNIDNGDNIEFNQKDLDEPGEDGLIVDRSQISIDIDELIPRDIELRQNLYDRLFNDREVLGLRIEITLMDSTLQQTFAAHRTVALISRDDFNGYEFLLEY